MIAAPLLVEVPGAKNIQLIGQGMGCVACGDAHTWVDVVDASTFEVVRMSIARGGRAAPPSAQHADLLLSTAKVPATAAGRGRTAIPSMHFPNLLAGLRYNIRYLTSRRPMVTNAPMGC